MYTHLFNFSLNQTKQVNLQRIQEKHRIQLSIYVHISSLSHSVQI